MIFLENSFPKGTDCPPQSELYDKWLQTNVYHNPSKKLLDKKDKKFELDFVKKMLIQLARKRRSRTQSPLS